jgi:ATP-dependent protease ClpP protease subunit
MFDNLTVMTEYERRQLRNKRIILLSGDVENGVSSQFIEDIHMILLDESNEPVTIIIASAGGDVFSGLSIIRAIRVMQRRGIKVIGQVHGQACSMAFFVLQCCDERVMGKLCVQMAHGVTTGFTGDMKNMDAERKLLEYWHEQFATLMAHRCKENTIWNEPSYWYEVLRDNTPQWYQSEECLEMGLIDRIEE